MGYMLVIVQPPRKYLALLSIAGQSDQAMALVREVLDPAAAQAYADVGKPFGDGSAERWLRQLLRPRVWAENPRWVMAIEDCLSTASMPQPLRAACEEPPPEACYVWN